MDKRDVKVTCPCCDSRLEVDVRSGKVVRWNRATEVDDTGKPILMESDWDDATTRVGGRLDSARDKFEDSLSKEKSREKDLDDLFKKASDKALGETEE